MKNAILTPQELKIMDILWQLGKAFIKEIQAQWSDEPKAYNTISTIVRILEEKGFVEHRAYGRSHEYLPKISREEYQKIFLQNTFGRVFGGSVRSLMSALMDNEQVSAQELDELKRMLDETDDEDELS